MNSPISEATAGYAGITRPAEDVLLDVRGLMKFFPIRGGIFQRVIGQVKAVNDVSFFIYEGETMGLVGESGCGKTTVGRCVLRGIEPTAGAILYRKPDGEVVDLAKLPMSELTPLRRDLQMIFQDPYSSLNPRWTLLDIVSEPLIVNHIASGKEAEERVADLLKRVGLRPEYMRRYPHAFSGGERQRVGIARALATRPRLVVADEPVSALDVSVRAQTLNLLQDLQAEFNLTYLFISHDLSVVEHICTRVAVMYLGKLVEMTDTERLYLNPLHPYTEALMSAAPKSDPDIRPNRIVLAGEVPNPANPPSGCFFHPRCRYAIEKCRVVEPPLVEYQPGHFAACHRAKELNLRGIPE